jgi:hypothetical protein
MCKVKMIYDSNFTQQNFTTSLVAFYTHLNTP